MDIVIEKGVGVGRKTRGPGRWQKILLRLDVGDSFTIDESNDPKLQQLITRLNRRGKTDQRGE